MKIYLIETVEAYMAQEEGVTAVRNLPRDTTHYKYDLLQETDVALPDGFTIEQTQGGGSEIFKGNEAAEMVTEKVNGRYVTSLVTSGGITRLHEWTYGLTYDVVFDDESDSNQKGWSESYDYCKAYIDMYNGSDESYFADYKSGSVSIICNETGDVVYSEKVKS